MNITLKSKKLWLIALAVVLVLLLAGIAVGCFCRNNVRTVSGQTELLYVERSMSVDEVISLLQSDERFSIKSEMLLRSAAKMARIHNAEPGCYQIKAAPSDLYFWRMLKGGWQSPVKVTFNNIRTIDQLAGRLAQQLQADSAAFLQVLTDSAVLQSYGLRPETAMTLFMPNTYEIYWTIKPQALLDRMQKEKTAFWTPDRLAAIKAEGLTTDEAYILASIVESETNANSEKARVAGLYINRLRKDMLLQSDPTVKFALGDFGLKRILNKHLTVDSPYNTYKYKGLPPGPIRMATATGLDAVVYAEKHNYLFMCAKETFDGTHNFAVTNAEHMQNARRYQAALNARGIK